MAQVISQDMMVLAEEWERIGRHLDKVRSGAIDNEVDLKPTDSHSVAMELLLAADAIMRHEAVTVDDVRIKYFIIHTITGRRELPFVRSILGDGQCNWIASLMADACILGVKLGQFWLTGRECEVDFNGAREPDLWEPLKAVGLIKCPAG